MAITNPMELIKIRLQVAGEVEATRKSTAISVVREVGVLGLYKVKRGGT